MASTSSLLSRFNVKSSSCPISHPMSRGAESNDQKLICVYCSSGVSLVLCNWGPHPTLPTISISGSLKWPGSVLGDDLDCKELISERLAQVSTISPVVRQLLPPTSAPHFQTSPIPY